MSQPSIFAGHRIMQSRLTNALSSGDPNALVRAAHQIPATRDRGQWVEGSWGEYVNKSGWGRTETLSRDAEAIREIRAALCQLPAADVCRAMLCHLCVQPRLMIASFGHPRSAHLLSPLKPRSQVIISALEVMGLVGYCDRLFTLDGMIDQLVHGADLLISLKALLADPDGHRCSFFSRDRLAVIWPGYQSDWIQRYGRNLYAYGFAYLDD